MKTLLTVFFLTLSIFNYPFSISAQEGVLDRIEKLVGEIHEKVVVEKQPPVDPPPTGPVISNVAVTATDSTATISWSLNEVGTGQVEYGSTTSYGSFSTLEERLIFSAHKQEISGLKPGTLYNFRVWSTNKARGLTISENFTFTTRGGAPTPPPPPPSPVDPPPPPVQGTIFVAPTGNDSNAGTPAAPFRTIQKAANVAKPGDVIRIAPGTYNERIIVPTSGVVGKPITFQGEPGAIIDGGDVTTGWTASTSCAGAFQKPTSSFGYTPHHASWDDKQIVWIGLGIGEIFCRPNGPSWDGVEALAGTERGQTYIRYRDGRNPNNSTVRISPFKTGVFSLIKKSHITIRGFTIKNGYYVVDIDGSSNNIVEQNTVVQGAYIIRLANSASGNVIRKNFFSQNYIYADYGHPRSRSPADYQALDANRVWGDLWGVGVWMTGAGQGNEITDNDFSRVMAGVWIAGGPDPLMNADTLIADNRYKNCADFCLLFHQGSMANLVVRDNILHEFHAGARFGPVYHGPINFTRNKFSGDSPTVRGSDLVFSLFGTYFPATGVFFTANSFNNLDAAPADIPANSFWRDNTGGK